MSTVTKSVLSTAQVALTRDYFFFFKLEYAREKKTILSPRFTVRVYVRLLGLKVVYPIPLN